MTTELTASSYASTRMPTFFIPHGGGPCFFMDWRAMGGPADTWDALAAWLRSLLSTLPARPSAIVVISGHWEEAAFSVASAEAPGMIYDYSGFPPHTYELKYPAPGAPALAGRIAALLGEAGFSARLDGSRGFDHGVFVPFLLIDPEATIPVVPMSLRRDLDPAGHLAAGAALAALRDEGVLIIGSGMSFHNMRSFRSPAARVPSATFDQWLTETVEAPAAERTERLTQWAKAPAGRESHPREEHLLPLMVAVGAAGDAPGARVFHDNVMEADISAFRFG